MRRPEVTRLTASAFCIALNITGAYIALTLRLPVYLDSVGTILAGALMGPWYAVAAGMGGAAISGITTDVYALYFMPAGMITGMMAGFLFKTPLYKGRLMPLGAALMTAPGTMAGAFISAYLFSGVTSSGSSALVQLLNHMGMGLAASAFVVQIATDYADRFLSLALVVTLVSCMTSDMRMGLKGGGYRGTV